MSKAITTAAEAEREADQLRRDLSGTLDLLLDNLAPHRLAAEAASAARARTPDWLVDYWALARSPVGLGIVGATAASVALGLVARRRWR